MKPLYLLLSSLPLTLAVHAQQTYTIRGKLDLHSKSRNIYIGQTVTPINSDGSFEISGEVPASHTALIHTDSSGADDIWLDPGTYTVECREYTLPGYNSLLFRTVTMKGPKDAELYNDFKTRILFDNSSMKDKKTAATRYLDSVFQHFPGAAPLARILIDAHYYLSDSATEKYIGMLPPAMEQGGDIQMLKGELKRNSKIKTEKYFEDFSMNTAGGETFRLSSLKGKKAILLDFWASSCAPCRAQHPHLIELYKKYHTKGLEIVSISIDDKREAWLDAIAKDHIDSWINLSELKGFETSLVKDYSLSYIPFHFLLDGDGRIIKVYDGGWALSDQDIESLLNSPHA
jgi:thiol-disulfide isomerase/thioredoxin